MSNFQHKHVNSEANPMGWKSDIENWLNTNRPQLKDIHGGIASGKDVHMWIKTGDGTGPAVKLEAIPAYDVVVSVETMLEEGTGVVVGFNTSDPPYMWVVRKV